MFWDFVGHTAKMKYVVLVAIFFVCTYAAPSGLVLPRLPASVILNGKYPLNPEGRIIGGSEVEPHSLPFMVSIERKGIVGYIFKCGGSILDETSVLTAANCVYDVDATLYRVVVGEHDRSNTNELEQVINVTSFVAHAEFDPTTLHNDIAILKLESSLDLNITNAKPIVLPPTTDVLDPPAGTIVTVSGWGTTTSGGDYSDVLRSIELPVVSDVDCNAAYAGPYNANPVLESMMCAGDINVGGIDACQGDAGGPLFTGTGATAVQHGIVSWGRGCALAGYPGVYTQVSYFLDWINEQLSY